MPQPAGAGLLASAVVLYYDYLLTLAREIEFFWPPKNRLGWASSLLLINRYVSIIGHIPILKSYLVLGGFSGQAIVYRMERGPCIRHAIFILTWYQALKIGGGVPLLTVLVRDGTMYFVVLSLLNLTNVLTLLLAPPLMKDSATTLTNVFSTVLMSRLMINLRTKSEPGRWRGQSTISTSMSFCDPAAPTAAISTTFQLGTHDSSGSSALASTSKHSQEPEAIELKDLTGAQPQQLAAVQEEPV
ncbi:hypothetical protein BC834DRAFT_970579 [Gloeopeniophorella convolvens]|nr:hypothetical protein BC834DRAFT_970579 [Gloeopeniophorella convolvens]